MKKFKNHQRPRIKYRFDIVGHKKALKIWWDSPFKRLKTIFSNLKDEVPLNFQKNTQRPNTKLISIDW